MTTIMDKAIEKAKHAIEGLTEPKVSLKEYLEALKDVRDHVGIMIDAAEDDIANEERLSKGDGNDE